MNINKKIKNVKKVKKILIVKNRALGDSIIGLATIQYIKSLDPDVYIAYCLPSWIIALYSKLQTSVDEYIPLELSGASDWLKLFYKLLFRSGSSNKKFEKFDLIYELHSSGSSYKFFKLFSILTATPYFYNNHHKKQGGKQAAIERDLEGVWQLFKCIRKEKLPFPDYLKFFPKAVVKKIYTSSVGNKNNERFIVLGISASRMTKVWPIENFIKLIDLILRVKPDVKFIIPISADFQIDREVEELFSKNISDNLNKNILIIKENLTELPLYIARAYLYIGNDTGLKHLSVAIGLKTFTFFGPDSPTEWHPYDPLKHPYFYIGSNELSCRTKKEHYCRMSVCDNTFDCLKLITVDDVFKVVSEDL
ncbi:MAG: glycosyltransferase family 9 protein [Oligoflexia bacterium]|nr:glycosyltransferase family 9 protein [Oligoflexia bacterium]